METVVISDGHAEVLIVPAMGAGLARYDWLIEGRREPLFRTCRDLDQASFIDLANFNMVPWSNRISGGGFTLDGHFHALLPNVAGQKLPIHGNGFQLPWTVQSVTPTSATLALSSKGPGPYVYDAEMTYGLAAGALTMTLAMTNRASQRLPFGGGFHPWLPREPGLTVQAQVQRRVLKDADIMPIGDVAAADDPSLDFSRGIAFPDTLLDTDYLGWDGLAKIRWVQRGIELTVDATRDPHLRTCIIYSPGAHADFFCFEPVNHRSDAHNMPGGPEAHGLVLLNPQEQLALTCVFTPSLLEQSGRTAGAH
jgi:aldose 1-epimerase